MPAIEPEVEQFAEAIDAINLRAARSSAELAEFAAKFKKQSYFVLTNPLRVLICKISRKIPPFWGARRTAFSDLDVEIGPNYILVLLLNPREGYAFKPRDVKYFVEQKKWPLAHDDNYKIYPPIPETYAFRSRNSF